LSPNTMSIRVYVDNANIYGPIGNEFPLNDVSISLSFPTGQLAMANGDASTKSIAVVPARNMSFVDFEVEPGISGILVWGTVVDSDGPVSGILIEFTGLLAGHTAVTDESGDFYFLADDLTDNYGWIGATALDADGMESEEVGRHL